nr:MAG TPA: hypothetical protein [Caudoviricetes sp.]
MDRDTRKLKHIRRPFVNLSNELKSISQDPKMVYPDIDAIMSNWTYINIFLQTKNIDKNGTLLFLKYELENKRRTSVIHRLFTRYISFRKAEEWNHLLHAFGLER